MATVQRLATDDDGPVAGNNGLHPTEPPPGRSRRIGRGLAWANRRVLAARLGWPDGTLRACEEVERARPDWYPNYWPGWSYSVNGERRSRPPGFYAYRWEPRDHHR